MQIIEYILIYWIIYFVLSFYDFIYMLFTVFMYAGATLYIAIYCDTRKIYLLTGREKQLCQGALAAGLPPWLRDHMPIDFSSFSLCLHFFFQRLCAFFSSLFFVSCARRVADDERFSADARVDVRASIKSAVTPGACCRKS